MSTEPPTTTPQIEGHLTPNGVRLVDPIEGSQFTLLTQHQVEPDDCDADQFYFPVDAAAEVCATEFETPYLVDIWVRDADGRLVAESTNSEPISVLPGDYNVEVASARMKLYLSVDGGVEVEPREDRVRLSFPGSPGVRIGVRSLHDQPAATITTGTDPREMMRAVSWLGSALKTTSCERSFPTLRGHPPLIELGDELDVPATIDRPETDVTIEIPPQLEAIFPVASLAYYLGARVEPGPDPLLVTGGTTHPLTGGEGFETRVAEILEQVFLLDCVTRTEGYYQVDLHERRVIADRVDLDFADLYDRPIAAQVDRYLSVPYDRIADAVPRWKLTADVTTAPEHVSTLPFLAKELAMIRARNVTAAAERSVDSLPTEFEQFFSRGAGAFTRSASDTRGQESGEAATEQSVDDQVFRPEPTESIEQTFVGDGIPLGASKMTVEAYYQRLDHEPATGTRTRVIVVCNDPQMNDENVVSEVYGTRDWLEFDITIREELTIDEMAEILRTDADFLHYIGHVDEYGIRCADGYLDARSLEETSVSAFLLNACQSYEQGKALVERGALGGIVTLKEVLNKTATEIGHTIARLLNSGFSLSSAFSLLDKTHLLARHYMVVGDGNATIVESESGTPYSVAVDRTSDDEFEVELYAYPSKNYSIGSLLSVHLDKLTEHYLNSGHVDTVGLGTAELQEYLAMEMMPVETDEDLLWSDELVLDEL
ncbi:hypothetical protein BRC83_03930 [Halobacteriales archaeon QS_1_68_17]|nr:MAG: hypothetical protein BRC83_03930 [Halobacteriales archaeon QS_1_68_17]